MADYYFYDPSNYINVARNSAYFQLEAMTVPYKKPVQAYTVGVDQPLAPVDPGLLALSYASTYQPTADIDAPLNMVRTTQQEYACLRPSLIQSELEYYWPEPGERKQQATTFAQAAQLPGNYGPDPLFMYHY